LGSRYVEVCPLQSWCIGTFRLLITPCPDAIISNVESLHAFSSAFEMAVIPAFRPIPVLVHSQSHQYFERKRQEDSATRSQTPEREEPEYASKSHIVRLTTWLGIARP
jgi:hypothetical protein